MQSCLSSICSRGLRSRTTFCFVCVLAAGAGECCGDRWLCRSHPARRPPPCSLPEVPRHGGGVPVLGLAWLERKRRAWKTAIVWLNICVCVCGLQIAECRRDAVASLAQRVKASPPEGACQVQNARVPSPVLQKITSCCPSPLIAVAFDAALTLQSHLGLWEVRGCRLDSGAAGAMGPEKGC